MLLERINIFLDYSNLSYNKFEKSINASRGTISRALKHNKTIGSNVVESILDVYPNLSAEWLLRGKGEMIIANEHSKEVNPSRLDLEKERVGHMIDFYDMIEESKLVEVIQKLYNNHQDKIEESHSHDFLEHFVLRTWEKKYGAELKHINRMLEIFYRERMERVVKNEEQDLQNKGKKSH
ncbi:hypothetical protein [Maribacter luteus]|uniref:hypothetical protein n=1 Tax=Maribacter luteus TaxID=2594478 RepID=UPI002492798A|nr:hypothetical protein [Maribacter luteus]